MESRHRAGQSSITTGISPLSGLAVWHRPLGTTCSMNASCIVGSPWRRFFSRAAYRAFCESACGTPPVCADTVMFSLRWFSLSMPSAATGTIFSTPGIRAMRGVKRAARPPNAVPEVCSTAERKKSARRSHRDATKGIAVRESRRSSEQPAVRCRRIDRCWQGSTVHSRRTALSGGLPVRFKLQGLGERAALRAERGATMPKGENRSRW